MDKFCVLLFGKNKVIINDFFLYHDERIDCISSSGRSTDLVNHMKYAKPNVMVYCMLGENSEDIQQVLVARSVEEFDVPLIIIGQPAECDDFERTVGASADLVIKRPLTISVILEKVLFYLEAVKKEQERLLISMKKHILVIDDDPLMLKVMKEYLHEQYEVATAINGKVAMKYLSHKPADLIFLDYQMPEESGPEVLEKLTRNINTRDIPVYFLTGVKERNKIQKALALKPSGYLLKPIERDKLLEVLAKHFSSEEDN